MLCVKLVCLQRSQRKEAEADAYPESPSEVRFVWGRLLTDETAHRKVSLDKLLNMEQLEELKKSASALLL